MKKEDFESEYLQLIPEKVPFAPYIKDMKNATVALLNTGGIVPIGNPDRIESSSATKYGRYDITGMEELDEKEFMSVHGGFDTSFANADPNRVVPVDVLKDLEKEGKIKGLAKGVSNFTKLIPILLKKHKENIYNVLAIVNDKTVEEIRKQNPVQTIKQLKELWSDKELLNF